MQRHAAVLAAAGFEVLLVGRELPKSAPLISRTFAQHRIRCRFHKGKLFYFEYNLRLLYYLIRSEADIHLAVDLDTLMPNQMVCFLRGRQLVFDAHEYFTEVPELQGRSLSKSIWEWVARTTVSEADLAYTVGPSLAKIFTERYRQNFDCIMNVPVLTNDHSVVKTGEKPVILYQGALNDGRGLEHLIAAMKGLDAELHIAGEGDLSDALRSLTVQLELTHKVKFLGWVVPENLPALTRTASVGINVLEPKGLSYQYSLANKFFDYLHAGIPQLCADFEEYRAINGSFEVACLCECNASSISMGLKKLLNDKDYYERLQSNCRKATLTYNLQKESEKLVARFYSLNS